MGDFDMLNDWIKKIFFPKRKIRKDLRFVTYGEAVALLKKGYTIAQEVDNNKKIGHVYLELLGE
jgi:hypothetical protein